MSVRVLPPGRSEKIRRLLLVVGVPRLRMINPLRQRRTGCVLVAAVLVLITPGTSASSDPPDALPFAKSFSLTGGYAVAGVNMAPQPGSTGLMTGTVAITGVPANAEVLSAFLYWETIWTAKPQVDGVKFRG